MSHILLLMMASILNVNADQKLVCKVTQVPDTGLETIKGAVALGRMRDDYSQWILNVFGPKGSEDATLLYLFRGKQNAQSKYLRYYDGYSHANYNYKIVIPRNRPYTFEVVVDVLAEEGDPVSEARMTCKAEKASSGKVELRAPAIGKATVQFLNEPGQNTRLVKVLAWSSAPKDAAWNDVKGIATDAFKQVKEAYPVGTETFLNVDVLSEDYENAIENLAKDYDEGKKLTVPVVGYGSGEPLSLMIAGEGWK